MDTDLGPPQAPHDIVFDDTPPPAMAKKPRVIPTRPAPVLQSNTVDEQKIEQEFGPPPDMVAHELVDRKQKSKLAKLLPALTRQHRSTKARLLLVGGALLLVAGAGAASFMIIRNYAPPVFRTFVAIHKPPTTVASTLTGLPVDPSVNNRPVTAVMIENSIDARPQSGLDQAGVVFEALAEGGVTRFMALYQDTQPDYLGPVRSARPYYVQWALGFDAAYAHVGGSPDALTDITAWHVKDMNQFYNSDYYERISTRYAPHNVYTSIAQLSKLEKSKGFGKSNYTGFARKKKETPSLKPTVTSIDLIFSGYYYNAHFDYSIKTNTYKRSESGAPHMEMAKNGTLTQIAPKVVIAMVVPEQTGALDATGAYYSDYNPIGTGKIVVFQDGTAEKGTWSKTSNTAPLQFFDTSGQPLALDPGQVWISAITAAANVTYK